MKVRIGNNKSIISSFDFLNASAVDKENMASTGSEAIMIELMKEGWDWIK